jgi:hypothetical protein
MHVELMADYEIVLLAAALSSSSLPSSIILAYVVITFFFLNEQSFKPGWYLSNPLLLVEKV